MLSGSLSLLSLSLPPLPPLSQPPTCAALFPAHCVASLCRFALDGNRQLLPNSLGDLFTLLSSSSNASVAGAAKSDQHVLQVQLMAEAWVDVVSQLNSTSRRASAQLQELLQKQQQRAPALDGDVSMQEQEEEGDELDSGSYGGALSGYDGAAADCGVSVDAAVDVLRFNAHMALALRALGLLPDPGSMPPEADEEDVWPTLQAVCSQVIQHYASHLARQQASVNLVPAYICHLRLPERRELATIMLQTALASQDEGQVGDGVVQCVGAPLHVALGADMLRFPL